MKTIIFEIVFIFVLLLNAAANIYNAYYVSALRNDKLATCIEALSISIDGINTANQGLCDVSQIVDIWQVMANDCYKNKYVTVEEFNARNLNK